MTNGEIIEVFEQGRAPGESFHHADHIRVAFAYLSEYAVLEALRKFSYGLRRFAVAQGKPHLYHETITWAYLFLIRERMARADRPQTWEEFAAGNPDLLVWEKNSGGILARYYAPETLASAGARAGFLMPDRVFTVS